MSWITVCAAEDIEAEDVIRFDHGDRTFAVHRSPDDDYHATDGLCTHEQVHLADGLVMDNIIECPKHNGQFDYRTGEAKGAPVCVNLKTYAVKIDGGKVLIDLGGRCRRQRPMQRKIPKHRTRRAWLENRASECTCWILHDMQPAAHSVVGGPFSYD